MREEDAGVRIAAARVLWDRQVQREKPALLAQEALSDQRG